MCVYREEEGDEPAITSPDGTDGSTIAAAADKPAPTELENVEEEEEDLAPKFTDEEEAIVQYLKEDEPLPNEVLDTILPAFWHEEPFK